MKNFLFVIIIIPMLSVAQYPFEKFESPKYKTFPISINENNAVYSKTIQAFFKDKSNLQIKISSNLEQSTPTNIQLISNKKKSKYTEELFIFGFNSLSIADVNGDGKTDIKLLCSYMGNGLAALNVRVIYFFQTDNNHFTKISFDDMMTENRVEKDLNNDGNFEIITMTLQNHKNHNYWLFNAYNFENNTLKCVNQKVNFPQMFQYLNKDNFKPTTVLSKPQLAKYQIKTPRDLKVIKH